MSDTIVCAVEESIPININKIHLQHKTETQKYIIFTHCTQ